MYPEVIRGRSGLTRRVKGRPTVVPTPAPAPRPQRVYLDRTGVPEAVDPNAAPYGRRDGGKKRAPKHVRNATPTYAAKGRGRGGVHGKGECGDLGKRFSIETRSSVLDARKGDRIVGEIGQWFGGGR
jgi:hypothetical protein